MKSNKLTGETFNCRKCRTMIDEHNQYLHDGMCDDCFSGAYFPKEAKLVETDVSKLPGICRREESRNMDFWAFLKSGNFDCERFNKVVGEIEKRIDCTKCANCCKVLRPILDKDDIERISKHLDMTTKEFIDAYLVKKQDGDLEFRKMPCVFLAENKCRIYDVRPRTCMEFPYLDKDVTVRCHGLFGNARFCPIVFNVLENAKDEFSEDMYALESQDI